VRFSRTVLAAVVGMLVFASNAAADHDTSAPIVSYTLTGTPGTNGWFRSNVTIAWQVTEPEGLTSTSGCEIAQLVTSEGTTTNTCEATSHGGTVSSTATLKIDRTAPTVSAGSPARGPDANGWYNHPVAFAFSGTDATSGIASCSSPTYGGGDGASVAVSATCADVAGNTSAAALATLKYDATAPAVTAAPDQAPAGAWYRRPLTVGFAGTDATSGIASCTAPVRYAGPDGDAAVVKGSCADAAGNAAEAALTFKYDATAPKLGKPRVEAGDKLVRITWPGSADIASVQLLRKPGLRGAKSSVVYTGKGTSFVDRAVRDGLRYRYELVVADAAGNRSGRVVTAGPRPPLYLPAAGQAVRAPPTLAWKAVAGARFYNVQLHRNGVKVLSAWPRKATLRLRATWSYAGKKQRLVPGRYRWYVWPAEGTLERPRFGRRLGSSFFVVRGAA
jgi:hypothetical protein